jgi:3-(3-hydroxy-phenyl)propionate hydroxylase
VRDPVLVVGAGPTGLTVAALLAQRGVPVLVVEQRSEPHLLPRAVHVDDEVVRVLQQVGIAERFVPLTRPGRGLRLLDAHHRTMAEFGRSTAVGEHGYAQANMFDQPDLERLLRERVAALPLVEVRTGCELVGLEPVRLRQDGVETSLRATAVLGCDGAWSAVRAAMGSSLVELGAPDRWLVVDVQTDLPLRTWQGVHQVCDPARAATYMQVGPDRHRWELRLLTGEEPADLTEPAVLGRLLQPWTGRDDLDGLELVRAVDYAYRACVADRWRAGRVLLLGDAAHQTPPFIGQGLGSGVRDAANLAWKLAAVLGDGADERLLDTYQGEREPHARALIRTARIAGLAMTGGERSAAALRAGLLSLLRRAPALTRSVLDRGSPPLRAGALVARRARPRHPAGRLLPQPVLDGRLLDDVLGDGWAVISTGPLVDPLASAASSLAAAVLRLDRTPSPALSAWLRRHRASAVVVRPDRTVLAATDRRGRLGRADRSAVESALALLRRD